MNSKLNDKKELTKTIVLVVGLCIAYKLISVLAISHIKDAALNRFVGELTLAACAVIAAVITKRLVCLKWKSEGFLTGILTGSIIIIISLFVLAAWIKTSGESSGGTVSGRIVILLILSVVLIGIGEELFYRGVLLNGMLDYFGEGSVSAIRKSIVFSGLIFGAVHIMNIFIGAAVVGVIVQMIDAAVTGMVFAAMYVRSKKNLWPGVVIHGFLDLVGFLSTGALMNASTGSTISSYTPSALITTAIKALALLFIIRKSKLLPLTEENSMDRV